MTDNAIIKITGLPPEVVAAGYSDKVLMLMSYCWADHTAINTKKTDLAFHLLELKRQMDADDPNAGSGGGEGNGSKKSEFWAAFERGHLPYQGKTGRTSICTALQAAAWLEGQASSKGLDDALRTLAPATIVEISNLSAPAQALAFRAIGSANFIGVAAVRQLARIRDNDTFDKLDRWVAENETKALTPKVIEPLVEAEARQRRIEEHQAAQRAAEAERRRQQRSKPASQQTVDVGPRKAADIGPSREELEKQWAKQDVQKELNESEQREAEELKKWHAKYSNALSTAMQGLEGLKRVLNEISTIKGTIYLDELRALPGTLGVNYVSNDAKELRHARDLLLEIVQVAASKNPPQSVEWETVTVEAV